MGLASMMTWRRANRVLIVSEAPSPPVFHTAFLHQPDIQLLTTYPDDKGLKFARRKRPKLIIEDLACPDHGGLDFCRELRSHPSTRKIPLILVASPELEPRSRQADADALLNKPLARSDFFDAVRRFIELPKRRSRRVELNLRFNYVDGEERRQVFSRDICLGGAFLKTDRLLEVGRRINLGFTLPGASRECRCNATVRGVSGSHVGGALSGFSVEFDDLDDADAILLGKTISRHLRRSFLRF